VDSKAESLTLKTAWIAQILQVTLFLGFPQRCVVLRDSMTVESSYSKPTGLLLAANAL